eukprot:TRINITY_DN12531_c0_g4_i3.p1 TRINITY_DN12531_c0_g4~~TRINITY_DN12531_c0_g4_i3.p1  ORF type:complete len:135 (+),score=33.21 TRINITY_DN12531_c0_g4_i3:120-524(+)
MEEEFTKESITKFLDSLHTKLSALCASSRKEASAVESEYDKVDKILENWKAQSLIILNNTMTVAFNTIFPLEGKVTEWNKSYKGDAEVMKGIQRLSTLLSEWKEYVKAHIMKHPLLTVNEYSKYEEIKKALEQP